MNIEKALQVLRDHEANYERAKIAADMASKEATECLNKLNQAQKAFDEEVKKIKERAPGGDWKRSDGVAI